VFVMSDLFLRAAFETFWYFALGALPTAIAGSSLLALLWSGVLAEKVDAAKASLLTKRFLVFGATLFILGAPANMAFTLLLRGRLYVPDDPFVDFLPWLPASASALGLGSRGHYLDAGSSVLLNACWLVLALPVWGAALATYRRLLKHEWQW